MHDDRLALAARVGIIGSSYDASAATSIGVRKGCIDESKKAPGRRGAPHRNRGTACRLRSEHQWGAADDIDRGAGALPSRTSPRPKFQQTQIVFSRARD